MFLNKIKTTEINLVIGDIWSSERTLSNSFLSQLEKKKEIERSVVLRSRGRGRGSYCLMGTELEFCKMKTVLQMCGGNVCITLWLCLIPVNCTLKMVKGASLVVQWLWLCAPNAGGLGSIPGQGTRFLMLQLKTCMPQQRQKILCAATKTLSNQISKQFFSVTHHGPSASVVDQSWTHKDTSPLLLKSLMTLRAQVALHQWVQSTLDCAALGWYKSNSGFALLNFCHLILEYILKEMWLCYISF